MRAADFSSAWKSSKSTAARNASSRSPRSLSRFNQSSTSKNPSWPPHAVSSDFITSDDTRIRQVFRSVHPFLRAFAALLVGQFGAILLIRKKNESSSFAQRFHPDWLECT